MAGCGNRATEGMGASPPYSAQLQRGKRRWARIDEHVDADGPQTGFDLALLNRRGRVAA